MLLKIVQIASGVLLVVAVLLQQRGTGLGSTFGGEGGFYRTRRGIEKILLISTIVLSVIFFGSATLNITL